MSCKSIPMTECGENRCVSFDEAVNWIAYQNFAGASVGPIGIRERYILDQDYFSVYTTTSSRLASDLLLDRAARGLIRIYAMVSWPYQQEDGKITSLPPPVLLSTEFLRGVQYHTFEEDNKRVGLRRNNEVYSHLFADAVNLTREFWETCLPRTTPTWHWRNMGPTKRSSSQSSTDCFNGSRNRQRQHHWRPVTPKSDPAGDASIIGRNS